MLLSLMQSGVVVRLKKGMREVDEMTTWIFAGVNRRDRQLSKDPDLARYVAERVCPTHSKTARTILNS